jgi:arylsulfatase A-like enzyme
MRRRGSLALALLLIAPWVVPSVGGPAAQAQTPPPNVVLIVADDMRWDEAGVETLLGETFPQGYLPTIRGTLVAGGFHAKNAFNVNSLCCPSRASILTGNYSHTTGVWNNQNDVTKGGWKAFRPREGSTLATWFDAAGYRTALMGKYFNGYNQTGYVPPGWDRWVAIQNSTVGYYNYTLAIDGTPRSYGTGEANYSTDVLAGHATDFIRSTPTSTPFFLMFTPYTPHAPYTPAPRHAGMFSGYTPKMPPNLAEADVSDKPAWVRALPITGSKWAANKRKQMEMLMALDDAIGSMLTALSDTGRLDNTIIVFTSDNGMSGGSHRWTTKKSPWDEALRAPFVAWGPGVDPGTSSDELILNIDIADTLGSLTGVPMPTTDGASAAGLLTSGTTPVHDGFVFERLADGTQPPSYCGYRTLTHKYVRYSTGEEELYVLSSDPWELTSRHADPGLEALKAQLLAETQNLCNPPPPGYSFG